MSFDTCAENKAFAEKYDFPFELLCDTDRTMGLAYGACDSAEDEHARRISYLIGPDGFVRHAWEKVNPATHHADVLAEV